MDINKNVIGCDLNQKDLDYCIQLARVGKVHISSSQVTLSTDRSAAVDFKSHFPSMSVPNNWQLEYAWADEHKGFHIIFKINKITTAGQQETK